MNWKRYLESVSVDIGIPATFQAVDEDGREVISIELAVTDHETGEQITVRTRRVVQPQILLTEREAAEIVRDLVRIAVLHEIDEAIRIDGQRVFDPHKRS